MEDKNENFGEINVTDKKTTLIKWILLSTTIVFCATTIVFLSLYVVEKKKIKKSILIIISKSQTNGIKLSQKVIKLTIKK